MGLTHCGTWFKDSRFYCFYLLCYSGHCFPAALLNTMVGYLLDESGQESVLKDPDMLKRLNYIAKIEKEDKNHIIFD